MNPPRLSLIDATVPLLDAAINDASLLGRLLGVTVADGWSGFPEALPILRAIYEKEPQAIVWGSLFFVEPRLGVLVGFGGFKGPPSSDSIVEIGYAIAPDHWGQGLGTDAVMQMVRRAFASPRVRAVDAHTLGEPNASTRVLTKAGFEKVAEFVDPNDGPIWHWRRER